VATRAERRAELLQQAATYRTTAVQVHDAALSATYQRMAADAERKAEQLAPRASGAPVTRRTVWKGINGNG
jgi:hypothetical protein